MEELRLHGFAETHCVSQETSLHCHELIPHEPDSFNLMLLDPPGDVRVDVDVALTFSSCIIDDYPTLAFITSLTLTCQTCLK